MSQMLKLILYSIILVTLVILLFYVSKNFIESIPSLKPYLRITKDEKPSSTLISSVIGLITVIVLCLTLFVQQKQHKETITEQRRQHRETIKEQIKQHDEIVSDQRSRHKDIIVEQRNQYEESIAEQREQYRSQIKILQKEHSFTYIDVLFEKFERNLKNNSEKVDIINHSIISASQEYLDNQKKLRNGNEDALLSHSNEFWTENEVRADIESLYQLISRFEFFKDEINKQESLNEEIKSVYLENLDYLFKSLSFQKAIDFAYDNKAQLKYVVDIFDEYGLKKYY